MLKLIRFFLINSKKVKKMNLKEHKAELVFCGMFALLILSMGLNAGFQSDWGNIVVDTVEIRGVNGEKITGKVREISTFKFVFEFDGAEQLLEYKDVIVFVGIEFYEGGNKWRKRKN